MGRVEWGASYKCAGGVQAWETTRCRFGDDLGDVVSKVGQDLDVVARCDRSGMFERDLWLVLGKVGIGNRVQWNRGVDGCDRGEMLCRGAGHGAVCHGDRLVFRSGKCP